MRIAHATVILCIACGFSAFAENANRDTAGEQLYVVQFALGDASVKGKAPRAVIHKTFTVTIHPFLPLYRNCVDSKK